MTTDVDKTANKLGGRTDKAAVVVELDENTDITFHDTPLSLDLAT
jgi:hypothetical protein